MGSNLATSERGQRLGVFVRAALLLACWGAATVGARDGETPRPIPPPLPTGLDSEEHFAFELRSPPGPDGKPVAARPVGVACLRRTFDDVVQLELEARFFEEHTRVYCIESRGPRGVELVWREWRSGDGRTLHARQMDGRVELVDWGRLEALRSSLEAPTDLIWPLEAIERARTSGGLAAWNSAPMARFDPLGRRVDELRVRWEGANSVEPVEGGAATGCARWIAADGALFGEFTFAAGVLREFRWQGGDLAARAIDAEEFARRIREHEASLAER
jgi:hypothetical protein